MFLGRSTQLEMHIYRSATNSTQPRPCAVYVFGGGMAINNPEMFEPTSHHLAHAVCSGYVYFSRSSLQYTTFMTSFYVIAVVDIMYTCIRMCMHPYLTAVL